MKHRPFRFRFPNSNKPETPEQYMLKYMAARYLWSQGYRCIGFNVEMRPYGIVDVVATKMGDSDGTRSIAIVDCIDSRGEVYSRNADPLKINEKESKIIEEITEYALLCARHEELTGQKINIFNDPEMAKYRAALNNVAGESSKCLYWAMTNAYRVANYHWIFGYEHFLKDVKPADSSWGLVYLKHDPFKETYKTYKKQSPQYVPLSSSDPNVFYKTEGRIARALCAEMIADKLPARFIARLSKQLTDMQYNDRIELLGELTGVNLNDFKA